MVLLQPLKVDFDNSETVEELQRETAGIPVGVLNILLEAYYQGGGEPASKNERLEQAYSEWKAS